MADPSQPRPGAGLIADHYAVDANRPLPPMAGLPAFGATDRRSGATDFIAVQVQRRLPPRTRALQMLSTPIAGLLSVLAHGPAAVPGPHDDYYLICPAAGPSLQASLRVWPEAEILERALRPAALVLEQLQNRRITHRGIRLDNLFQHHRGEPVLLGLAWATPPGLLQPALYEPPYSAMCLPVARGDGSVADDVYALGVVLLCLALGRVPLAHLDDAAILRRKLELGSFAALAGEERLPAVVADLARGMLAEDPEHRPTAALLLDPASARGRRVAARPPRRAQRSIIIADTEVWNTRSLVLTMANEPEQALHALIVGTIVHWLRRGLGDGVLAARLEELQRRSSADQAQEDIAGDPLLVMQAVAILDPLAPLCWRGIALWPDGLGAALAAAQETDAEIAARLELLVMTEAVGTWAAMRADRCDAGMLRVEARQQHGWLQPGGAWAGGRLVYMLNPSLPCASPLMQGRWAVALGDLLPALEAASGKVDHASVAPMDMSIATFIAARSERRLDSELKTLAGAGSPATMGLTQLRLLAQLQLRQHAPRCPGLAGWLVERAEPVLATWRNRPRRLAIQQRLQDLVPLGQFGPILALLDDHAERAADDHGALQATQEVARIDAELAQNATGANGRAAIAQRLGQEIAAGVGLAALAAALMIAAFG